MTSQQRPRLLGKRAKPQRRQRTQQRRRRRPRQSDFSAKIIQKITAKSIIIYKGGFRRGVQRPRHGTATVTEENC